MIDCLQQKRGNHVPIFVIMFLQLAAFAFAPATGAWQIGCFEENAQDRKVNISAGNYMISDLSAQECTALCAGQDFRFAGTEGQLCFCSNFYDPGALAASDILCDAPCSDLAACGNKSYIRVYDTQGSMRGLEVSGPSIGIVMEEVRFTINVERGDANASYTFDFGDGSFILTTCPNATHTYKRTGVFQVKASARTNTSGPISNSTWVSIQSAVGVVEIEGPTTIVKTGEKISFHTKVSQGTEMAARWTFDDHGPVVEVNLSDSSVHSVGSKALYGNVSGSPERSGTYLIPLPMIGKAGHLMAWELFASKVGPVKLQIYRPKCASSDHFCQGTRTCIPKQTCPSVANFTCARENLCAATGHCLPSCSPPNSSYPANGVAKYTVVSETLVNIASTGWNTFHFPPEKSILVEAGDVIGWAGNLSSGDLAFENSKNEPTLFFPAQFPNNPGSDLLTSNATEHDITPILQAHISQFSLSNVLHIFKHSGQFNVSVEVKNDQNMDYRTFPVLVEKPITHVEIISPRGFDQGVSYERGVNVLLQASANVTHSEFTWFLGISTIKNVVVFNSTGLQLVFVTANNSVSRANASVLVSVLEPVGALTWTAAPLHGIDVDEVLNLTFKIASGMNVTITVEFGDGDFNKTYLELARNTTISMQHVYRTWGKKAIEITADNNIQGKNKTLQHELSVWGKMGNITVEVRPSMTTAHSLNISTDQEFEISVSSSENTAINYTFFFGNGHIVRESTSHGRTKVSHKYEEEIIVNVVIQASLGQYSENRTVLVQASDCGPPAISMNSLYTLDYPMVTTIALGMVLKANVVSRRKSKCAMHDLKYQWHITETVANKEAAPAVPKNSRELRIEPRVLNKGKYMVRLTVTYRTNVFVFQTYIEVKRSLLVPHIMGGSFRTVAFSTKTLLTLNASQSQDPDYPKGSANLEFTWQCASAPTQSGKFCGSSNVSGISTGNGPSLTLNISSLTENVTYTFRVTVKSRGEQNGQSAEQKVLIEARGSPDLEIWCHANCEKKINFQERLVLRGKCKNCDEPDELARTWSVKEGNQVVDIYNLTKTGMDREYLVLKANALGEDKQYTVTLKAKRGISTAVAQFEFRTSKLPHGGNCRVWPEEGFAAKTKFHITCEKWTSVDTPLSYQFRYQVTADNLGKISSLPTERTRTELWSYGQDHSTPSSVLPIGNKENQYQMELRVRILNRYNSFQVQQLYVTVKPEEIESYKELNKRLTDDSNTGAEPQVILQWAEAISSVLNQNQTTPDTREEKEQIRFKVVEEIMTKVQDDSTLQGVEQKASALSNAIENKEEVSSRTQTLAAKGFKASAERLKSLSKAEGTTRTDEVAQTVLTGVSKNFEASSTTTEIYIDVALEDLVPKTGPPSRDWSLRIRERNSDEEAAKAEEVVGYLYDAMNNVGDAMMRKRVKGESKTTAITQAFTMGLELTSLDSTGEREIDVKLDSHPRIGRFLLPGISDLNMHEDNGRELILQVVSFKSNPIRWDKTASPRLTNEVIGLTFKRGAQDPEEITIKDTKKDIEIFTPNSFRDAQHFTKSFKPNVIGAVHRYRLAASSYKDNAKFPLLVQVKPEDGQTLTVYFRMLLNVSIENSDLKFEIPNHGSKPLPPPFRRVDAYSFMIQEYFALIDLDLYLGIMGPNMTKSQPDEVTINYTVGLQSLSCVYWSPSHSPAWLRSGCRVGDKSTSNMTHCLCDHLTFFSAMVVKPNPIGPLTVAAFVSGYALFVAVAVVFFLYFLGLIWARKKDRADTVKVGACPLQDNDPVDPHRYELTLWTSMRFNAGTTSKVSITLYGEENDSDSRVLQDPERSTFQRGSVDTFLLTTPLDLGPISYIRIWHDNSGGSWFLSRIMIIDLQTEERYYFICDRWLAVDEDDGQVERVIPLASNVELTEFQHLFMARTRRNLSDNHLWFSVLARPANSRFTRVQRLSCCLCLLLMSMMANAMYYETSEEPTATNSQKFGSLVFTWDQVYIGIVTSLIVFPVNLVIVQIFRSVKPKPHRIRNKPAKTASHALPRLSLTVANLEDYRRIKEPCGDSTRGSENSLELTQEKNDRMRLSINDVHTDVDRVSFTSSPLLVARKSSPEYGGDSSLRQMLSKLRHARLPYFFVYVAWFLVFALSVSAAVMVILYGMTFGNGKSLQWLASTVVSFIQDVLITQPLKVLGMAIFFALVVKKPDKGEFEVTEEALKLAEDEEWLHTVPDQTSKHLKKVKLVPPDHARLLVMRNARMKERKMYAVLREVVFFYVFLCLLLTIAYSHRDPIAFHQTQNFVDSMAENFTKLTSQEEFWAWTHTELLPTLFPSSWYNGADRQPDGFLADHYSQLVGGARMRLLRAKTEPCMVPESTRWLKQKCYGSYFITNEDKVDYTKAWTNVTEYEEGVDWDTMPWRHQSFQQLDGYPFWGRLTTYGGGGYVLILEPGMDNRARIDDLKKKFWIDRASRAILTEFTIYNAGTNLFTIATLVSEFPATGGVVTYVSLQTARLYDYTENYMLFVLSSEIVFVLFVLFFFVRECKNIRLSGPSAYFKQFWNVIEFSIVAFTFAAVALYVYRALSIRDVVERVAKEPFKFKSFQFAAYWNETYTFLVSMIVFFSTIKMNKLLRFNRRMSLLSSTLRHACFPLSMFGFMFAIVFCGFATMATLFFGQNVMGYRNFISSLTSLLSLMLGKTNFSDLERANRITGPLFFFAFMFLISMVLVNMFLSIIIDSFIVVKHDNDKQSNEYEIVDFIIERFKMWTGIGVTRRARGRQAVLWETAASKVKAVRAFQPQRLTVDERGFYTDNVSKLEDRLERILDKVEMQYQEYRAPQKRKVYTPNLQQTVDELLSSDIDYRYEPEFDVLGKDYL